MSTRPKDWPVSLTTFFACSEGRARRRPNTGSPRRHHQHDDLRCTFGGFRVRHRCYSHITGHLVTKPPSSANFGVKQHRKSAIFFRRRRFTQVSPTPHRSGVAAKASLIIGCHYDVTFHGRHYSRGPPESQGRRTCSAANTDSILGRATPLPAAMPPHGHDVRNNEAHRRNEGSPLLRPNIPTGKLCYDLRRPCYNCSAPPTTACCTSTVARRIPYTTTAVPPTQTVRVYTAHRQGNERPKKIDDCLHQDRNKPQPSLRRLIPA